MNHVTRNETGDSSATRRECLHKLDSVGGSNLVREFAGSLVNGLADAVDEMRAEFSDYKVSVALGS
jgi:hypothetical protein